nr:MAG TPA: hypothetical protein [Caudoviricetes sp.]
MWFELVQAGLSRAHRPSQLTLFKNNSAAIQSAASHLCDALVSAFRHIVNLFVFFLCFLIFCKSLLQDYP